MEARGSRAISPPIFPAMTISSRAWRNRLVCFFPSPDIFPYSFDSDELIYPAEFFGVDAPIYIIDEPTKPSKPAQDPTLPNTSRKSVSPSRLRKARAQTPPRRSSTTSIPQPSQSSTTYQEIDYSAFANVSTDDGNGDDPLADSVYFAQHRRAERKEKQLRNIEKERAMHEKVQLERLLDGLQGPDWLKVMGISGVTDGEKKDWEPKRDYFVKEVEALVDKFRLWKEQEKRVRAEKEAALAREEEEEESSEPGMSIPFLYHHHRIHSFFLLTIELQYQTTNRTPNQNTPNTQQQQQPHPPPQQHTPLPTPPPPPPNQPPHPPPQQQQPPTNPAARPAPTASSSHSSPQSQRAPSPPSTPNRTCAPPRWASTATGATRRRLGCPSPSGTSASSSYPASS